MKKFKFPNEMVSKFKKIHFYEQKYLFFVNLTSLKLWPFARIWNDFIQIIVRINSVGHSLGLKIQKNPGTQPNHSQKLNSWSFFAWKWKLCVGGLRLCGQNHSSMLLSDFVTLFCKISCVESIIFSSKFPSPKFSFRFLFFDLLIQISFNLNFKK